MKTLRILIVEDDALVAMFLGELLIGMGHDICETATTLADAVSAAHRHRPDIMIVDGKLGRESGLEAVDEITRTVPAPHFFLSGDVSRIRALRPNAIVVQKPFRLLDLTRALEATLNRAHETVTA